VKRFDLRENARSGWFDEVPDRGSQKYTPGELERANRKSYR
jgi:hypothetical protein